MYNLQFWQLCWSNFLFSASFSMMLPELPDHLKNMGGESYLGLIISLFTFTAGLSRPFSGKLTDTIGRVPVMVFGSLVCCVCGLVYPFVSIVWAFLLLRLVHGFSTGTKPTATAAYIADVTPENRRGEASGILGIFTATGMSIGPTMGSYITTQWSINAMFYASVGAALLSVLILGQMKETLPKTEPFSFKLFKINWQDIYEPRVMAVVWITLLTAFSSGVVITLIPDFSKSIGISNKGFFFTIYTIASIVVRVFTSKTSDRYGRQPVLVVSCSLLAIGMFALGFWQNVWSFWVGAICFGIAWGLNTPTLIAWTIDLSLDTHRGRALATMYLVFEWSIGLGALVAGWWYGGDVAHLPHTFIIAGILALISAILLIFGLKPRPEGSLQ